MTHGQGPLFDSLPLLAYIIERAQALNISDMTVTKAQRLMYACYGVLLAVSSYRISDETPETGAHGPVFPRTVRAIKACGFDAYIAHYKEEGFDEQLPEHVKRGIDATLQNFGQYSQEQLCKWSTLEGSPWDQASSHGTVFGEQLQDSQIKQYFRDHVVNA